MIGAYRIIWKHHALKHDIANFVYLAMESGGDTQSIVDAMTTLDQLLSTNPSVCGESRGPFERFLYVEPLAIDFEIYEDEKIVYIARVRYAPKKQK